MALWQLVHLDTPMYAYMLPAFKKPKSAQVTTRAMSIINRMSMMYVYYLNTTCPSGHHHNGFMGNYAAGHTHIRWFHGDDREGILYYDRHIYCGRSRLDIATEEIIALEKIVRFLKIQPANSFRKTLAQKVFKLLN